VAETMTVVRSPLGGFDVVSYGVVVQSFCTYAAAQRHVDKCDDQTKGERRPEFWWMRD
jgi:hypothetical protein